MILIWNIYDAVMTFAKSAVMFCSMSAVIHQSVSGVFSNMNLNCRDMRDALQELFGLISCRIGNEPCCNKFVIPGGYYHLFIRTRQGDIRWTTANTP